MKNIALVFAVILVSTTAFAQSNDLELKNNAISGKIYFTGAIVTTPCTINMFDNYMKSTCYDQSKQTNMFKEKDINLNNINDLVPIHLAATKVTWLDNDKRMAVVNIAYR